jgi:hypothetical protein
MASAAEPATFTSGAHLLEHFSDRFLRRDIVVDHHHAQILDGAAIAGALVPTAGDDGRSLVRAAALDVQDREGHREGGSLTDAGAVGVDRSAVLLDEVTHESRGPGRARRTSACSTCRLERSGRRRAGKKPGSIPAPVSFTTMRAHPFAFSRVTRMRPRSELNLIALVSRLEDDLLEARGVTGDRADGLVEGDVELEGLALHRIR